MKPEEIVVGSIWRSKFYRNHFYRVMNVENNIWSQGADKPISMVHLSAISPYLNLWDAYPNGVLASIFFENYELDSVNEFASILVSTVANRIRDLESLHLELITKLNSKLEEVSVRLVSMEVEFQKMVGGLTGLEPQLPKKGN